MLVWVGTDLCVFWPWFYVLKQMFIFPSSHTRALNVRSSQHDASGVFFFFLFLLIISLVIMTEIPNRDNLMEEDLCCLTDSERLIYPGGKECIGNFPMCECLQNSTDSSWMRPKKQASKESKGNRPKDFMEYFSTGISPLS